MFKIIIKEFLEISEHDIEQFLAVCVQKLGGPN